MSSKSDLRLDWCSHDAAKYAVEHWHYSHRMPAGKNSYIGAWEGGKFIGALVFGLGAGAATDGRRWGLAQTFEVGELVRVALTNHQAPVSRMVAIALRMLKEHNPGLRLMVSFADPRHGHAGGIYQAGGWVFTGDSGVSKVYIGPGGREYHERVVSPSGLKSHYGKVSRALRQDQATAVVAIPGKHRYLMPLDDEMRARIAPLARPYPRASRLESEAPGVQPGDEGAAMRPTRSNLQAAI